MSHEVSMIVKKHSRSRHGARTVAFVLAETAHHDGVAWATIDYADDDPQWKKDRSLRAGANLSERQVRRAIERLQLLDELETVIAFDRKFPRRRFYVHRLIIAKLRLEPVDYERGLPRLAAPFWTVEELQEEKEERRRDGHVAPWIDRRRPDILSGRAEADDRTNQTVTAGHPDRSRVDIDVHPHSSKERSKDSPPTAAGPEISLDRSALRGGEGPEIPAAAEAAPARDAEITAIVRGLPGADSGSPRSIIAEAHLLPRPVFLAAVETVEQRLRTGSASNACGLLMHLLRIARKERAAAFSAQLQASLNPAPRVALVPVTSELIKREEPDRYVRLMAKVLSDHELRVALADHPGQLPALLELAHHIRAGDQPGLERDTPEQARRRWVERHARVDPADHIAAVINSWAELDPLEAQDLYQLADDIREQGEGESSEAAA